MDYPLPNFHFTVQWGGRSINFSRVRNLAMKTTPIKTGEGASPVFSDLAQPGRQVYENFFLERSVRKGDNEFFEWWRETQRFLEGGSAGSIFRRDITISVLNDEHEPVLTWRVKNAFPVRLSWSELDGRGNAALVETLEIQSEGIDVRNE